MRGSGPREGSVDAAKRGLLDTRRRPRNKEEERLAANNATTAVGEGRREVGNGLHGMAR